MTTFDDREKSYEKKFALDEELKFKVRAAPQQAAGRVGGRQARAVGPAVEDYIKAVRKADLASKGDEDVFRRSARISTRRASAWPMPSCARRWPIVLAKAVDQIEAERKGG